jgi:hypothetical protein
LPRECDYNTTIASTRLFSALDAALNALGRSAKDMLMAHLADNGIAPAGKPEYALGEVAAAFELLFCKDAADLLMELVWNALNKG